MFRLKFELGYKVLKQSLIIAIVKKQASVLHTQNVKLRQKYVPTPQPLEGSWNWAQNIQDFLAGICESERASIFHSHQCVAGWLPACQGGATAEGGRGSHRSSDYRFPGGGPDRPRGLRVERPSGRRTADDGRDR